MPPIANETVTDLLHHKRLNHLEALEAEGLYIARPVMLFGGARRDEEKSRAKERVYSFRDAHGQ